MPIALLHERDKTYRMEISGLMLRADYARAEAELTRALERSGTVKLLCVLKGFEGWETGVDWSNLTFYVTHGDSIERIAIVGDEQWRSLTMMFAGADLRKAPVEFFPEAEMARARAWLSA
jgi:SpoIIAA-like